MSGTLIIGYLLGLANPFVDYFAMAGTELVFTPGSLYSIDHASVSFISKLGSSIGLLLASVGGVLRSATARNGKHWSVLDSLIEQAPEAVVLLDAHQRVVQANRAFLLLFGYWPKEVWGRRLNELIVPEEFQEEFRSFSEAVAAGRRVDAEAVRRRKDGSLVDVSILQVRVNLPGEDTAVYAIYRDISERKQTELKLREYEKVVEGLEEMISVVDRDYRYLIANRAFLNYRELKREEVIGHRVPELLGQKYFETLIKPMLDECFRGKVVNYEIKFTYPRLGERELRISYFPIEDASGVSRAACILQDITDRKRVEEEIRVSSEQLRALASQVETAKDEEGKRIARDLHDELGGGLTTLKWELETFDQIISESGDYSRLGTLREKVHTMLRQVQNTISTVRNISSELRLSVLDELGPVAAIEWQARELENLMGIPVHYERRGGRINLDREQATAVFRIFQEALTNIIRHAEATSVDVRIDEEDGEFTLTVRDNGRGISDEDGMKSLGVRGMQERARLIGADLQISGLKGEGTIVTLRMLLSRRQDKDSYRRSGALPNRSRHETHPHR